MADTRFQPQTRTGTQVQIDQGLRSYMLPTGPTIVRAVAGMTLSPGSM